MPQIKFSFSINIQFSGGVVRQWFTARDMLHAMEQINGYMAEFMENNNNPVITKFNVSFSRLEFNNAVSTTL